MKINSFLNELRENLEIESMEQIFLETNLLDIDEWDSLNLLVLINYLKISFDFELSLDDIEDTLTPKFLIEIIESRSDTLFKD